MVNKRSLYEVQIPPSLHSYCFPFSSLYYRVVRLPPEADSKGAVTSVCVEIEDTISPEVEDQVEESGDREGNDADEVRSMKRAKKMKNISFFFDMTRRNSESFFLLPQLCVVSQHKREGGVELS